MGLPAAPLPHPGAAATAAVGSAAPGPVAVGTTPFLPCHGTGWIAGATAPAPSPPLAHPTAFLPVAPQLIAQYRNNV
eukprot:9674473-Alexandrium_andersonii.AAC.1